MTWLAGSPHSGAAIVPMTGIPTDGDRGKLFVPLCSALLFSSCPLLNVVFTPELSAADRPQPIRSYISLLPRTLIDKSNLIYT